MYQNLIRSTDQMLEQLQELLQSLDEPSYRKALPVISNASIGEHVRHCVEFFQALIGGVDGGSVCYDRRKRDPAIQTDPQFAADAVQLIRDGLANLPERGDAPIKLEVEWLDGDPAESTLGRELHYVQDHLLHHSALIKVALRSMPEIPAQQVRDFEKFGVAPSTLTYQASLGS